MLIGLFKEIDLRAAENMRANVTQIKGLLSDKVTKCSDIIRKTVEKLDITYKNL
jgi:hypothetical protein